MLLTLGSEQTWRSSFLGTGLQLISLKSNSLGGVVSINISPCLGIDKTEFFWCHADNGPILVMELLDPKDCSAADTIVVGGQECCCPQLWARNLAKRVKAEVVSNDQCRISQSLMKLSV